MAELRLGRALEFRDDLLGQHLAELDPPLIEGVNVPDDAMSEDGVFIERHELTKGGRRELLGENGRRWTIAFEHPVRYQPVQGALGLDCLGCFTESQRFSLGEDVRQEDVVVPAKRMKRL